MKQVSEATWNALTELAEMDSPSTADLLRKRGYFFEAKRVEELVTTFRLEAGEENRWRYVIELRERLVEGLHAIQPVTERNLEWYALDWEIVEDDPEMAWDELDGTLRQFLRESYPEKYREHFSSFEKPLLIQNHSTDVPPNVCFFLHQQAPNAGIAALLIGSTIRILSRGSLGGRQPPRSEGGRTQLLRELLFRARAREGRAALPSTSSSSDRMHASYSRLMHKI